MIRTMRGDSTWSAWQGCEVTRRARIEDLAEQRRGLLGSDDAREGMMSFIERREARFAGK